MSQNELVPIQPDRLTYAVVEEMVQNGLTGRETVTFSLERWQKVEQYLEQVEHENMRLRERTPVKSAYGLCTAIGCQWNMIVKEREKWKKQETYVTSLNDIVNDCVKLITSLVEAKVLPMEEWWSETFAAINRRLEDLRRL